MKNFYFLIIILLVASCRKELPIVNSTATNVTIGCEGVVKGFFLLNEGNMGSNKSSLDYFEYKSGDYYKNIFAERNPQVTYELGDVGNDLQINGDRLYAVINCSNLVEVMDLGTAHHIGSFSVPNCRYITFDGGYAYVSSYAGEVELNNPNARLGYIAKVDTATLKVVDRCEVGYQPEQMVVTQGKIYVANSGGYMAPNYDNRVSVIDIESFKLTKHIEVAENLHRLQLDKQGKIWVSSRGDYGVQAAKCYLLDPTTDSVVEEFDFANSGMTIVGDSLYIMSRSADKKSVSYSIINTSTREVASESIIDQEITTPYAIAVHPITREILITDAGNYVTPGRVYCFSHKGEYQWRAQTGDIPSSIVFSYKELR